MAFAQQSVRGMVLRDMAILLQLLFIELSGYILFALMACYTLASLLAFFAPSEGRRLRLSRLQSAVLFLLLSVCFIDLTLVSGNARYLFFFVFLFVFLLAAILLVTRIYEDVNRPLLNHMCLMLGIGLCIVSRLSFAKAYRQYVIELLSFAVSLPVPYLLYRLKFWKKLKWGYAAAGVAMLGIVLILGGITHGSKISYTVAGVTFQPSEFVKITFLFFLAAILGDPKSREAQEGERDGGGGFSAALLAVPRDWRNVLLSAAVAAVHILILVASRDLGNALLFFAAYIALVVIATRDCRYLAAGLLGGAGASAAAYRLFDHVRVRFLAWRDPWTYIDKQGYQIAQSLFAIAGGEWFGAGLGRGSSADIPYVERDFIFSAVCEELGVLFGVCLLAVSFLCFAEMMRTALRTSDRFYRLLSAGSAFLYLFQIFLTVGGGIKFIPLTGITYPLVSYGGSSVMSTMLLFFLVQAIHLRLRAAKGAAEAVDASGGAPKRTPSRAEHNAARGKSAGSGDAEEGAAIAGEADHPKAKSVMGRLRFPDPIRGHLLAYGTLFAAMAAYLIVFVAVSRAPLLGNSYNSRIAALSERNLRGTIYAADGEVLARSYLGEDGEEVRVYPYGSAFAHAVGYATRGRIGVEETANYYLATTRANALERARNAASGGKSPGNDVYTTLDTELQRIADEYLSGQSGAVIVTEVKTGRILAMVSHPDFDPNEIEDLWEELTENKDSSVLVNRAAQGIYPPGSTFKIVTALEYYRENGTDWEDYTFDCTGSYAYDDSVISCYHGASHGRVDFAASFAKSCNSSFANIGMGLDGEELADTLQELLFGGALPVRQMRSAASVTGDVTQMGTFERMQTSIGQGRTGISPLHLNLITMAIANGGTLAKPYLIERIETPGGRVLKRYDTKIYGRMMSEDEADFLTGLMEAVVEEGTASRLSGQSYTAAGKTGSAEYGNVKGASHAWFTGFAPADEPEIAVTVLVEGAGTGAEAAVPIAKRILDAYFAR